MGETVRTIITALVLSGCIASGGVRAPAPDTAHGFTGTAYPHGSVFSQ